MGLEPTTPGTTIRCSNQLSYTHHTCMKLVRQEGLEPPAYCLEGSCSIHLSYWRIFTSKSAGAGDGNRTHVPSLEGWCTSRCATPASLVILPLENWNVNRKGRKSLFFRPGFVRGGFRRIPQGNRDILLLFDEVDHAGIVKTFDDGAGDGKPQKPKPAEEP